MISIGRLFIIVLLSICLFSEVYAESWDHDANIKEAVNAFDGIYFQSGISGVAEHLKGCYAAVDKTRNAQQFQRCAAIDSCGRSLDLIFSKWAEEKTGKPLRYPYFTQEAFVQRINLHLLSQELTVAEREELMFTTWETAIFYLKQKIKSGKIPIN